MGTINADTIWQCIIVGGKGNGKEDSGMMASVLFWATDRVKMAPHVKMGNTKERQSVRE